MLPGVVAAWMKLMTGAKLIIEIATTPEQAYLTSRPEPSLKDRILHLYSDLCLHVSVGLADRCHFLYPDHLRAYPLLRNKPNSVFHDFVPVSTVPEAIEDENETTLLLVGAPWFLKGADLLIRAFLQISPEFPTARLKIIGHFPHDREQLAALANGSNKVEILKARPNPEVLEIMSRAAILVLPSRCEGMGRVLIEAMAAGLPVVGSEVGGIPFMISHGENGFLFPSQNVEALAGILRKLLADPGLRREMGRRGFQRAHQTLNEATYVQRFTAMVTAAFEGRP
jgi:glycosyltransferase involved in cell wall biosynthesis